ncbi:MAG: polymer-forming cytoskeletal protein [Desulfovibrio sp.]
MSKQETLSILGSGCRWNGLLEFNGTARIDSIFTGDIRTGGLLVVGPEAEVRGTLTVGELDVSGKVVGDVVAEGKLILRSGAELQGDLRVGTLEAEEGSVFNGRILTTLTHEVERPRRALIAHHAEPLAASFAREQAEHT